MKIHSEKDKGQETLLARRGIMIGCQKKKNLLTEIVVKIYNRFFHNGCEISISEDIQSLPS